MNNLEDFIFYDKIYNNDTIDKLKKYAQSIGENNWSNRDDLRKCFDKDTYNRKVFLFNDKDNKFSIDYDNVLEKYLKSLNEKNSEYLRKIFFSNNYFVDEKISKYNVNNDFLYHVDEICTNNGYRILSTITYLNDDYCGGETEFFGKIIKPKKGYTLIFPSNWLFPHCGKKVLEKIKYLYVCHYWIVPQVHDKNDKKMFGYH